MLWAVAPIAQVHNRTQEGGGREHDCTQKFLLAHFSQQVQFPETLSFTLSARALMQNREQLFPFLGGLDELHAERHIPHGLTGTMHVGSDVRRCFCVWC